jgi:hypothetical protein
MLANSNLDAAKLNRCLQVSQSAASLEDLLQLAHGCLDIPNADSAELSAPPPQSTSRMNSDFQSRPVFARFALPMQERNELLEKLCCAFKQVQQDPLCWQPYAPRSISGRSNSITGSSCGLFHQRDFVYLLRFLRRITDREASEAGIIPNASAAPFTYESLLEGLRRNFGGVSEESFCRLAHTFLDQCRLHPTKSDGSFELTSNSLTLNTVATLQSSLHDKLTASDDPSTAAFRHILLLDPTDVESAAGLLFEMNLLERSKTAIVLLSEFADDAALLRRSEAVARIKEAAERGETVLLSNAGPIASSIFDLLNKHYTSVSTHSQGLKAKIVTKYYAQVAIGSFSRPCVVHPSFRIIVHVSE